MNFNDYNDTLGAGSYPEPPEEKEKWYIFKCLYNAEVQVFAKNENEARELIESDEFDDLRLLNIEDILEWSIE